MDLIDNSIAGAKKDTAKGDLHGYIIKIRFSKKSFSIKDNCGGISLKDAINYVFKLGYDISQSSNYSSSGFGIGMKRAIFKIGKEIEIQSSTKEDSFSVKLDVNQWLKEEGWKIALESKNKPCKGNGTNIVIKKINPPLSEEFNNFEFQHKLSKEIEKKNRADIRKGLIIVVNTESLGQKDFAQELLVNNIFNYKDMSIEVKVMKNKATSEDSGWYICLNENMVVRANKDNLTGWGVYSNLEKIEWDAQTFTGFMGYVTIKAKDTVSLPFTTTKEINKDDDTYRFILTKMINATKECKGKFNTAGVISIQYKKKIEEVELLKKCLQVTSASKVGIKTFDHYLEEVNHGEEVTRSKSDCR